VRCSVSSRSGGRGLKTRTEPEERDLTLAQAKIGELMMRLELAEQLLRKSRTDSAATVRPRVRAPRESLGVQLVGWRDA
jgi:hypothetical protein